MRISPMRISQARCSIKPTCRARISRGRTRASSATSRSSTTDGWTCTPGVDEHVAARTPTLAKTPAASALLLNGAYTTGETVTNPELAALLQRFADEESVASMYAGDVGREIAAEVQRNGPPQRRPAR